MARLDTRLEAEAAEFLVLGQLLLSKIAAYKTYTNMPGYDLVATNPSKNLSAKIQVKSRWSTGASGFPIKAFGCDFVVFCRLNRGQKGGGGSVKDPEYFVFPVARVRAARIQEAAWNKVYLRHIRNAHQYRNAWHLIADFLRIPKSARARAT